MLPHPGETESVLDTEQTTKELLVTDEDLALAWNASRSFTVRKNRFFQDQEGYLDSETSPAQLTAIDVCIPQKTPKFLCESPKPKTGESHISIAFPSTLSGFHTRSNKVHLSWKGQNLSGLNRDHLTFEDQNTIKVTEEKIKQDDSVEDIDLFQHRSHSHGKYNARKEKIKKYIESISFNVIVGIFTVFALLSNDIGILIDSRTLDTVFDIIALISFFVFAGEMLLALYVEDHYKWSLFFWLDLFSTLSILIHVEFILEDFFPEIVHKSAGIAEASRASRLVTREGKIIQLVQVFQIGRLYKHVTRNQALTEINHRKDTLQKAYSSKFALESKKSLSQPGQHFQKIQQQSGNTLQKLRSLIVGTLERLPTMKAEHSLQNLDPSIQRIDPITKEAENTAAKYRNTKKSKDKDIEMTFKDVEEENIKETRIAKKLSDYTMKHIIVLVIAILLIMPLFESLFYFEPNSSHEYQAKLLQLLIDDAHISEDAKEQAISLFISLQSENDPHLVYLKLGNDVLFSDPGVDINHLKHSQAETVSITMQTKGEMILTVSFHKGERIEAILEIVNTIFICLVLTCGAVLLHHDAQKLVLNPLEKIIHRVNNIVRNPASAREPEKTLENNLGFKTTACMVEHAIVRMSELLAVGFGDTGSAIITQNFIMSGDLTSLLVGKKKVAIFGVCEIHDFIETTEILQEETLLFVNTIANIVHSMTDKYTGIVNQNIGDAFLLMWKFPEDTIVEKEDGQLEIVLNQVTQNMADCSVIAFMKIYARINRDPTLLQYRRDMRLNPKLSNYMLKMGFGLHVGWAIEGAVGSEHKIDSYYLSPDVNMAGRLEAGTRQYNVPLLFSGDLYAMLSDRMKSKSRLIDEVEVEGLDHPLRLYTVNMSLTGLGIAKDKRYLPRNEKKQRQKKKKEYIKDIIQNGYAYTLLHTDRDLKKLLKNQDLDVEKYFEVGFKAYVDGDWISAKQNFEKCLEIQYDGPADNLLNYIKLHDFERPEGWERRKVILKK